MKRFRKTIILSMLLALTLCVGAPGHREYYAQGRLKIRHETLFLRRGCKTTMIRSAAPATSSAITMPTAASSCSPRRTSREITVTVDSNAYVSGGVCYETRPTNYSTILGASH